MSEDKEQLIKTPGPLGDNFMLERELGRGGMGGVYLGRDIMLDRPVAVKVMQKTYGEDPEFLVKFKKEAQAAAKLIHPNIAQIYSYGVVDNMPYIAMELVAGGSLLQVMKNAPNGTTDIPRVLKICEQVGQALRCAADQGLVHGDIKPENILLDANGNAKLVDFGLAGMQKDTSEIWGTPYYIAPEKLKKEPVDYRADMYNLGGTLYHALTGVAPFEGEDANAVVRKRFEGLPKKPSEIRHDIPAAVDALVMKMLAFDKADRFPTFESLLEAFKIVMAKGLTGRLPSDLTGGNTKKSGTRKMSMTSTRRMNTTKLSTVKFNTVKNSVQGNLGKETGNAAAAAATGADDTAEGEDNANPIRKVLIGVFSGIALIGLIIGALVWYQISDRKSREEEKRDMIAKNIENANQAISDTVRVAEKFGRDFEDFAARATTECESATKRIAVAVPEYADRLKPEVSAELLAAIALTNGSATAATTNAAAVTVAAAGAAEQGGDAASSGDEQVAGEPEVDETLPAEDPENPTSKLEIQIRKLEISKEKGKLKFQRELKLIGEDAVKDVNDIWNRAYSCQASVIKIGIAVRKVLEAAGKAGAYREQSEANMRALEDLSRQVTDLYNDAKGSRDVENVQKGISFIKSKGAKALKLATDNLFRRRAEFDREIKKIDYEIGKLRKEIVDTNNRCELVAQEIASSKDKFDALLANKNFELLEWDAAIRELEFLKSNFKTPEGSLAADDQLKKVRVMKSVQEVITRNMKGFQFRKSKLGKLKASVHDADMKEIRLTRPDANKREINFKINWVKFYKEYHANFNELIIQYIENGRKNCNPKLTLQEWGDVMCGAALTLRLVCSDDPAAQSRGEQIAKEVAKNFPSYVKKLRMMFPDLEAAFANVAEEE